ncbi:MAG: hypothetical protein M9939_23280 [Mesorhizobium sp.]|nr:hypothetical protein [Mesorhizobium sp.]MCO5164030.1 hypothetical protein [Mesorhizobium sp.]
MPVSTPEEKILFNSERAAVLEVRKARSQDALGVLADVQDFFAQEASQMPQTVSLSVVQDMTTIVRDRLQMLMENGVVRLLLMLGVMSAFFQPRIAWWAAMSLPVAFFRGLPGDGVAGPVSQHNHARRAAEWRSVS